MSSPVYLLLIYYIEHSFAWFVTVGQLTNVFFKFCLGIPINEYDNKTNICVLFIYEL
jgi:hypothetical protein